MFDYSLLYSASRPRYESALCPPLNFSSPISVILQTQRLSTTHLEDRRSPWQTIELLCKKNIPCRKEIRYRPRHKREILEGLTEKLVFLLTKAGSAEPGEAGGGGGGGRRGYEYFRSSRFEQLEMEHSPDPHRSCHFRRSFFSLPTKSSFCCP